jgi:hypothetical protein
MAAMVVPLFSWPSTSQITAIFKNFSLFFAVLPYEARNVEDDWSFFRKGYHTFFKITSDFPWNRRKDAKNTAARERE